MSRDRLASIREKWRGLRLGERRVVHDGVAWRLEADVFWSRQVVEALRDAPEDVAWLLGEVERLRSTRAGGDPTPGS